MVLSSLLFFPVSSLSWESCLAIDFVAFYYTSWSDKSSPCTKRSFHIFSVEAPSSLVTLVLFQFKSEQSSHLREKTTELGRWVRGWTMMWCFKCKLAPWDEHLPSTQWDLTSPGRRWEKRTGPWERMRNPILCGYRNEEDISFQPSPPLPCSPQHAYCFTIMRNWADWAYAGNGEAVGGFTTGSELTAQLDKVYRPYPETQRLNCSQMPTVLVWCGVCVCVCVYKS